MTEPVSKETRSEAVELLFKFKLEEANLLCPGRVYIPQIYSPLYKNTWGDYSNPTVLSVAFVRYYNFDLAPGEYGRVIDTKGNVILGDSDAPS